MNLPVEVFLASQKYSTPVESIVELKELLRHNHRWLRVEDELLAGSLTVNPFSQVPPKLHQSAIRVTASRNTSYIYFFCYISPFDLRP